MARLRVRNEILRALGMFMLEKGKILEKHDYDQYGSEVPIRSGMALNHFGSWSRILQTMEGSLPELWNLKFLVISTSRRELSVERFGSIKTSSKFNFISSLILIVFSFFSFTNL